MVSSSRGGREVSGKAGAVNAGLLILTCRVGWEVEGCGVWGQANRPSTRAWHKIAMSNAVGRREGMAAVSYIQIPDSHNHKRNQGPHHPRGPVRSEERRVGKQGKSR